MIVKIKMLNINKSKKIKKYKAKEAYDKNK